MSIPTKTIRILFLLFLFLASGYAASQEKKFNEIENLLKKSDQSYENYDNIKAIHYALKAKGLAFKDNDSKYLAESYYQLSLILSDLTLTKESLYYVDKAFQQKYTQKDKLLQAKLVDVKSYNYYISDLSQTIKESFKSLKLIENDKTTEASKFRGELYVGIAGYYENTKINFDSAYIFYKLAENEYKKVPERQNYENLGDFYIRLGGISIKTNDENPELSKDARKKNYDRGLDYYQKSFNLVKRYNPPTLQPQYQAFADYYYSTDQYPQALEFYLKSIKEKNSVNNPYNIRTYRNISELYEILGDKENHAKYKNIFDQKIAEADVRKSKNIDHVIKMIINDKQAEYEANQTKKNTWIIIGIVILLILFFLIYRILHKKLKHTKSVISEVTNTLQAKEEILVQKHIETEELQLKVNDAYNEVIELAKKNDPSFYLRFQEVYPEFHRKLLEVIPDLRTSELILCAYTFLGFSIKDVAEYTYKSVNTIRNRKQNLRKKFSIPTEQDMGIWLRKLIDTKE